MVSGGIDWDELRERPQDFDLPASVLGYLRGELGEPVGHRIHLQFLLSCRSRTP